MNFESILISLLVGLVCSLILIMLARLIPLRMHAAWKIEVLESKEIIEQKPDINDYALSLFEKLLLVAASLIVAFSLCVKFGINREAILFFILLEAMLLLAIINFKHQLLPNNVVFPLLWLGLLSKAVHGGGSSEILGAILGYMIPFVIVQLIKFKTGKLTLGFGDIKCFAMLGAWFGASALPTVFVVFLVAALISSILFNYYRKTGTTPTGIAHFVVVVVITFELKATLISCFQ